MTEFVDATVNGRWSLRLPEVRRDFHQDRPEWEVERLAAMAAVIKPGDVVYDVGAEQGDLSALYAQWSRAADGGGVVLIEPEPAYWPQIAATWRENDLPGPLGAFVGFASDRDEFLPDPEIDPKIGVDGLTSPGEWPVCADGPIVGDHGFRNLSERAHDTPQVMLDEIAQWVGPPDVITIDVEGAELVVLRGARGVLTDHRPVVFVSVHPDFMGAYDTTVNGLHAYMRKRGYLARHIATDHEEHWVFWHPEGRTYP